MSVLRSLTKFLCVSNSCLKIMLKDYDRNQKKENYKRSTCIWTERQVTITILKRFSIPLSIFYNPGLLKRKEPGSSDRAQASLGHCLCQSITVSKGKNVAEEVEHCALIFPCISYLLIRTLSLSSYLFSDLRFSERYPGIKKWINARQSTYTFLHLINHVSKMYQRWLSRSLYLVKKEVINKSKNHEIDD